MIREIMAVAIAVNILLVSCIVMVMEWLLLKVRRPRERFIYSMAIIAFLVSMLMIDHVMGFILSVLDK